MEKEKEENSDARDSLIAEKLIKEADTLLQCFSFLTNCLCLCLDLDETLRFVYLIF